MSAIAMQCPRCGAQADLLSTPACSACQWSAPANSGVLNLLTEADLNSPALASYFANYDQIADDDLSAPILSLSYVKYQAQNMARYAGPVSGKTILDLGCGQGFLTRMFQERGARTVAAVDLSMAYLERLAGIPGVIPIQANAERLPFTGAFDLVVSTDVMEHVLNLGSFLVCLNRSLRDWGEAIIRVPYRESLIGYSAQAGCKYPFVHLRTFDRNTLTDVMASAGFTVEHTWFDGFNLSSPRPVCVSTPRRQILYGRLQKWLLERLPDAAVVTTWPWPIAATVMTPKEIVVKARKTRSLEL
jgi:SAM-dependent methyltransferase